MSGILWWLRGLLCPGALRLQGSMLGGFLKLAADAALTLSLGMQIETVKFYCYRWLFSSLLWYCYCFFFRRRRSYDVEKAHTSDADQENLLPGYCNCVAFVFATDVFVIVLLYTACGTRNPHAIASIKLRNATQPQSVRRSWSREVNILFSCSSVLYIVLYKQ